MGRGYVIVEGHGEQDAVLNLLSRLWKDAGLQPVAWAEPIRGRALLRREGLQRTCELVRSKRDAEMLLVVSDDEDGAPCQDGPRLSAWLAELALPFPASAVLAYREYESLFLPCLPMMAGKPLRGRGGHERAGLLPGTVWSGDFEAKRGVKEWLSKQMPAGRAYKPSVDQLPLTQMVDLETVRASGLAWFGTLERALRFLDAHRGRPVVYPPPAAPTSPRP